ncbi:MAG: hypothetical protein HC821_04410 [Lewinella sp.]|nr:hypothetical protein [Lewinella sp.]
MAKEYQEEPFQTQLRDYLSGDLNTDEQKYFDETLANSAVAQEELAFSQKLNFAQQHADVLAIAVMVNTITGSSASSFKPTTRGNQIFYWLGGTLMVCMLVAGAWWGIRNIQEQKAEADKVSRIITPYLQPLEALLATSETAESELKTAMENYRTGNFTQAAPALATYASKANDSNAALYAGISYLLVKQAETALPLLASAAKASADPVQDAAQFYQTICLIQLREWEKARQIATQVSPQDLYYPQYQELLDKLTQ